MKTRHARSTNNEHEFNLWVFNSIAEISKFRKQAVLLKQYYISIKCNKHEKLMRSQINQYDIEFKFFMELTYRDDFETSPLRLWAKRKTGKIPRNVL